MSQSRANLRTNSVPDDYPVRPNSVVNQDQLNTMIDKNVIYTFVLLGLIYFIHGSGISIYGPLYPKEATSQQNLSSYIYGSVISTSSLVTVIFYPIACRMVSSLTCKHSLSMSVLMIGVCRILFGVLSLSSLRTWLISLQIAVQAVEGVGTSILLSSTFFTVFSLSDDRSRQHLKWINLPFCLGFIVGPICGVAVKKFFGFGYPFYGFGVLAIVIGFITAIALPEPPQKITLKDIPILSWVKKKPLLIYALVTFSTFNYIGFLSVLLEPLLRQFHLDILVIGLIFAIIPFTSAVSSFCWIWLTKKGFNSVLLICLAGLLTFVSLMLIEPAPFVTSEMSLSNVLVALVLNGLGLGGKLACAYHSASLDLRATSNMNSVTNHLLVPTMFSHGSLLGYFSGSIIAGFAGYYLGFGKSTYVLYALETLAVAATLVYSFKRNYRSPRYREVPEESDPILQE